MRRISYVPHISSRYVPHLSSYRRITSNKARTSHARTSHARMSYAIQCHNASPVKFGAKEAGSGGWCDSSDNMRTSCAECLEREHDMTLKESMT